MGRQRLHGASPPPKTLRRLTVPSAQVPPFIAYYAVLNNNQTLLQQAYLQCSLYHSALSTSSGLWKHILFGTGNLDPGFWATGNAWAAMGMLRVLATIKKSQYAGDMQQQQVDLQNWIEAILSATNGYIVSSVLPFAAASRAHGCCCRTRADCSTTISTIRARLKMPLLPPSWQQQDCELSC